MASWGTAEHGDAELLFVALAAGGDRDGRHDRADEPDLDGVDVVRLREGPAGTGVLHLFEEVLLERRHMAERLDVDG